MSDLTQTDIDEAIEDYQQRIADLVQHTASGIISVAAATTQMELRADTITSGVLSITGEPQAVVHEDGSIELIWLDGTMPARLSDSVVRVIAAAILATSEPA